MKTVTSRDGTAIAYDQFGQGPAVVLVGGAFSYRNFPGAVELATLLSPRFTVINYDRRGRGDSGDTAPYSVAREVEDLEAIIAAAGGSAHVFGMSSGAALALTAAAGGSRVTKLAMYEPPYMVGPAAHQPPRDARIHLERLIREERRGEAVGYFIHKVMGAPRFVVWIMRMMPFWSKLKATAHTLPYDLSVLGDFSFPDAVVRTVRTPSLIIAGEKSPQVLRDAAKAVADALPGVRHSVLAGQSHNVSMKALAPVLADFFAA